MSNPVVALLGKEFEFIRIDKIKSSNPILFIEDGKLDKCKVAIEKLGITAIYTTTSTIEYFSDPIFANTLELNVHLSSLDYSPIQHLKKLKKLTLTSSAYDYEEAKVPELDLGCLENLTSLHCGIPNTIVNLNTLTKLAKVEIANEESISLDLFKKMSNLRELKLVGVESENLKAIENLSKLTKLHISGTHTLSSIAEISTLEKLKTLELRGNGLSDLSGIESLKSLEKLDLNHFEKIENSSVLSSLSNLKDLSMHNIKSIDTMAFILSLKNLKKVFMQLWSIHPEDASFLPVTQKLVEINALKQVLGWEDIYPHLDETGQKLYKEHFKGSALDYIKKTFDFYQDSYSDSSSGGPYTKANCTSLNKIIHELIDSLGKHKKMAKEEKIACFKPV